MNPYSYKLAIACAALPVFLSAQAQEMNLQEIEWTASSTASLPSAIPSGYDGYMVSGSLGNQRNYFISASESAEDAVSAYIKFGQLTSDPTARIYFGGHASAGADAYFGDISGEVSEALTLERFYGGAYFENSGHTAYVGNLKTTVNADLKISSLITGAGQAWNAGTTMNVASSSLTLNGGTYISNIYGGAHVNGAVVNIKNGSSLVINTANVYNGGDYVVAGGSMTYGDNGIGGSNIEGGSSVYLGAGANFYRNYTTYIVGGNFGYQAESSVIGGSSVTVDGATLDGVKIFGGSQSSGVTAGLVSSVDSSKVYVKSGEIKGDVYGGSHSQSHGSTVVTGDSSVEMTGGNVSGDVAGGSLYWNANHADTQAAVNGNTSVKITGGSVGGNVYGGSEAESYQYNFASNANIGGSSNVEIGGTAVVSGSVYGGSFSNSTSNGNGAYASVAGGSNVAINGGTVEGNVYGGGLSVNESAGTVVESSIGGPANITLSAGKILGDIYAGGSGEGSKVEGGASVKFVGNASDIIFSGTVYGGGDKGAEVVGQKLVAFGDAENAFKGTFSGKISEFDKLAVENSATEVAFANAFSVSTLLVDSSASVSLASGTSFDELGIMFAENFTTGDSFGFDLASIFGDSTTIVESALASGTMTVMNGQGSEFSATYDGGQISVGAAIPEPASLAAIFGALALIAGACRRKN